MIGEVERFWHSTSPEWDAEVEHSIKIAQRVLSHLLAMSPQLFPQIHALPVGKGEMVNLYRLLDWALGGWKLAGNGIYQSALR
jgi:hypothetical protein